MRRWGPYEIIQGYYLGHVLFALDELGVLKSMEKWQSPASLAKKCDIDAKLLNHLLRFLFLSTNLLQHNKKGFYKLATSYADHSLLSFQIKKFIGAYGPAFSSLSRVLHDPLLGEKLTNEERLAAAFRLIDPVTNPSPGAQIASSLGLQSVIDLGCGSGTLLEELAAREPRFSGWGVDRSAPMCRLARERLAKRGFHKRVKIIHGHAEYLRKYFPSRLRHSVDGLFVSSLLNEWFNDGDERVITFLRDLKSLFPERVLVVADYYGKLNSKSIPADGFRHTIIHDVMQVVTRQGVPPGSQHQWEFAYRSAGCTSLRSYQGTGDGLSWFFHVLSL